MSSGTVSTSAITTELLLQIFDLPVSFHRCLIPLAGGVTAALMLSHAIAVSQELDPAADGWFLKSRDEWNGETGLSRWELETARRTLREAGFLEERRAGLPAKLYYRVRSEKLWQALQDAAHRACRLSPDVAAREGEA